MSNSEHLPWLHARRPEAWAGELRVNLVRLVAIVVFYARHLVEFYRAAPDAPIRGDYHARVTLIVMTWATLAVALHVVLSRRRLPRGLPYASVLLDVLMTTLLCVVAGGPRTLFVMLYFLVIATSPLRLSLPVVYTATAGAVAGYLFLVGHYAWYVIGFDVYYATPELRVPRGEQAIIVLSLLVAGLFAGQAVRQARRLVERTEMTVVRDLPAATSPPHDTVKEGG